MHTGGLLYGVKCRSISLHDDGITKFPERNNLNCCLICFRVYTGNISSKTQGK